MKRYIALLRGVNVGGKSRVVMSDLKQQLLRDGFINVQTYINSGNIIFSSDNNNIPELTSMVADAVNECSGVQCEVVIIAARTLQKLAARVPDWWGKDPSWKHNLFFLISPTTADDVLKSMGDLKPSIEAVEAGEGIIYQSMSFDHFGKTTTGKLASSPIYRRVTIRNYNTVMKLVELVRTD